MNTTKPTDNCASGSAINRRVRFGALAVIMFAVATAVALLIGTLSAQNAVRFDMTATGDHSLSPATKSRLDNLTEDIEVVVSIDLAQVDPIAYERLTDVLEAFKQASPKVRYTIIDVGNSQAATELPRVIRDLAKFGDEQIQSQRAQVTRASEGATAVATSLTRLADGMVEVAQNIFPDQLINITENADLVRQIGEKAQTASTEMADAAAFELRGVAMPATDLAQEAAAEPMTEAVSAGRTVAQWAQGLLNQNEDAQDRQRLQALVRLAEEVAAGGRRVLDRLTLLEPLEPLMVSRALLVSEAVLVISPLGTTAIDTATLLPRLGTNPGATRFAAEDLLGIAIGTLTDKAPPILAIVHAEPNPILDAAGRPLPDTVGVELGEMIGRLRLRRIDVVEWATATNAVTPTFSAINPAGDRPIVWMVLPAPGIHTINNTPGYSLTDHTNRTRQLAAAIQRLTDLGEPMLISLEPSNLPSVGSEDPIAALLAGFGVVADTGKPFISRIAGPTGSAYSVYLPVSPLEAEPAVASPSQAPSPSPLSAQLVDFRALLHWAMPITIDPEAAQAAATTITPLLRTGSSADTWAESQWLGYRAANVQRPMSAFRPRREPTFDTEQDTPADNTILAVAVERPVAENLDGNESSSEPQRLVVVAAPGWYQAPYLNAATTTDGRTAPAYPGNWQLLSGSVAWLAGRGDELTASGGAQAIARIPALSPSELSAIRWGTILGLPIAILILGIALNFIRNRP